MKNVDEAVVAGFGEEWSRFDYSDSGSAELQGVFDTYFAKFPWSELPPAAVGFDLGCGTGRWARLVAPRIGTLHCIDPSDRALDVARRNLGSFPNCVFHQAAVDAIPLADGSADFGYSLGVLHHVPDTQAGINACVAKLRKGAPFALYLYYSFDNRPLWYRALWGASNLVRRVISRSPHSLRFLASQILAAIVYWPLARTARALELAGLPVGSFPLSFYRNRSFYIMRTDALDRFGTRLEKRFSKDEMAEMMRRAGLSNIQFNDFAPFWTAVGIKA